MNLSPEVAHLLRQALNEAKLIRYRDYDADGAFQILSEAIENLLPPLPPVPGVECDQCGQCLPNGLLPGDLCPQCDEEHAAQVAEEQADRRLETALACKCGAWGISYLNGLPYHCADCVCGAE